MKRELTTKMTKKEKEYRKACSKIQDGLATRRASANTLQITERQMYRIYEKYKEHGEDGLIHGLVGKSSNRQYDISKKAHILSLICDEYKNHSPSYITSLLQAEHSITIHPNTIRTWMRKEYPERVVTYKQKGVIHRKRNPKPAFGMMLQGDGSFHHWFGDKYAKCCLLVLIDDSRKYILCRFAEEELIHDMLLLLFQWCQLFGIPSTLYFDERNAYHLGKDTELTLEDLFFNDTTHYFPHVCERIGTTTIKAHSPQAKGRVERVNRTLQDRLCAELQRHKITSIEAANEFLTHTFLPRHNAEFALPLDEVPNAHIIVHDMKRLYEDFAHVETRVICNDGTISYNTRIYQIHISRKKSIPKRSKIICKLYLDNSFKLFYNGRELNFHEYNNTQEVTVLAHTA